MQSNHAIIVADLGFGDAGKGSVIDFLARKGGISAVVRYNGGGQAAHNVVTPDGRHHTFRQFGSGMFVPGMRTYLSRFMLVDPSELMDEAARLKALDIRSPFERLFIDEDAVIVTPFHRSANALRETLRGEHAHGTCGMGIGETVSHSLNFPDEIVRAGDLRNKRGLVRKLVRLQERFYEDFEQSFGRLSGRAIEYFAASLCDSRFPFFLADNLEKFSRLLAMCPGTRLRSFAREGNLLFEGAQGVLLDEWYGFHPHTTWSTTTFSNAEVLLNEIGYRGSVEKLGVLRAYHTRHGAGPFVTEDAELTRALPDPHNGDAVWQGNFRCGWFDLVMARYALSVTGGADSVAITNLDRFLPVSNRKVCTAYRFSGADVSSEEEDALLDVSRHGTSLFASGIKKKKVLTDLAYQEMLTGLLKKAAPSYVAVNGNVEEYLNIIEENLGIPVSMTSYGPAAIDKRSRVDAQHSRAA